GEVVDVEDVRVMQARNGVRLAIEALADLLSRMEVGMQHLHGDGAPELGVPAPPHHGHSALPDLLLEPVPAQLHRTSAGTLTRVSRFYSETPGDALRRYPYIPVSRAALSGRARAALREAPSAPGGGGGRAAAARTRRRVLSRSARPVRASRPGPSGSYRAFPRRRGRPCAVDRRGRAARRDARARERFPDPSPAPVGMPPRPPRTARRWRASRRPRCCSPARRASPALPARCGGDSPSRSAATAPAR